MSPFVGEIKLVPYEFAPQGWAFCHGQLMVIAQNTALFSLLGALYGGDGVQTFGLPDLRGRAATSFGQAPNSGTTYSQGAQTGVETVTLNAHTMPAHTHLLRVSGAPATLHVVEGQFLAMAGSGIGPAYGGPVADETMPATTITVAGANQPHENLQPYLALNYVIALNGIYPS